MSEGYQPHLAGNLPVIWNEAIPATALASTCSSCPSSTCTMETAYSSRLSKPYGRRASMVYRVHAPSLRLHGLQPRNMETIVSGNTCHERAGSLIDIAATHLGNRHLTRHRK